MPIAKRAAAAHTVMSRSVIITTLNETLKPERLKADFRLIVIGYWFLLGAVADFWINRRVKIKHRDKNFRVKENGTNGNGVGAEVSRRAFLGTTLAGSAALLAGGLSSLVPRSTRAATSGSFLE